MSARPRISDSATCACCRIRLNGAAVVVSGSSALHCLGCALKVCFRRGKAVKP